MSLKKLTKNDFTKFVDELVSETKVFGVQAKGDRFEFAPLESAGELRLDYDVALQAPKKYFQPPCEKLLTFTAEDGYKNVSDDEKFVLLGVHPYDMIALEQMKEIFSQGYRDDHYMSRRDNATIIACDVVTPSKNVFASAMKTAVTDKGFDILLTDIGDAYIAEAATEKGEALLAKVSNASDASDEDIKKRQQIQDGNEKNLNKHELACDPANISKLLDKPGAYDHPVYAEKAKTCFSCGSCTQVCPTCYCFSVQEDVNWDLASGKRTRSWDGCMLDGFTKVAGDHEFRKERADRFRHRIYRKGKYVPGKIGGQIACVGCGRCVSACLPDIANPVAIYNRLIKDLCVD